MNFDRIAVTGGSGRLGRFVVAALARHCRVTVLDRAPPPADGPADFIALDVRDGAAVVRALAGHDAVVHLAALDLAVEASETAFFETNVQGTWTVFLAAHELGLRKAMLISSVAAYGLGAGPPPRPPRYLPIDEDHPLGATHGYGLSKIIGEEIALAFVRRGRLRAIALRPSLVMRPGLAGETAAVLAGLEAGTIADDDPRVTEMPLLRSYVRPEDVANCVCLALANDEAPFSVFNVTADDGFAPEPTLDWATRQFGVRPEVRRPEFYVARPFASAFDTRRAHERLGWKPTGDWAAVVAADAAAER